MKLRSLIALVLLSVPTATGCVLEVDADDIDEAALMDPLVAPDEAEWASEQFADDEPQTDRFWHGAQQEEPEGIIPASITERADPDPTPWHLKADPAPDPWIGEPDD